MYCNVTDIYYASEVIFIQTAAFGPVVICLFSRWLTVPHTVLLCTTDYSNCSHETALVVYFTVGLYVITGVFAWSPCRKLSSFSFWHDFLLTLKRSTSPLM